MYSAEENHLSSLIISAYNFGISFDLRLSLKDLTMKSTVPHGAPLQGGVGFDMEQSRGVDPLGEEVATHFRSGVKV